MLPSSVVAVAGLLTAVGLVLLARRRWRTREERVLVDALEDRLDDDLGPGTGTHLERAPTVRRLAVDESDGPAQSRQYVPVVRIGLETTDAPGMDLVFDYVAAVLESIHPELADRETTVARYDVEFAFGPDGLLVDGECRRVAVEPDLAARLVADDEYRAFDLRRDVERGGEDDDSATKLWVECQTGSRFG